MQKLIWLDSAVEDMERLRIFLVNENLQASIRAATAIKEAVKRLTEYPQIGKPVNDLPGYRDLLIRFGGGGYLLRYRIHEDIVYIVQVKHYREKVT